MKVTKPILFCFSLLAFGGFASGVSLDISEAEDFNLVTWRNADLINSSAQGRVAVGGNAKFKSYSIGGNTTENGPNTAAFVVGGNLNAKNGGSVGGGSIYVGSNYNGLKYDLNNAPGSSTYTRLGENLPFNFEAVKQALTAKSSDWGQESATGTSTLEYSTLTLEGEESGTNIFNVDASVFDAVSSLKIFVPDSAKVLINISGAFANLTNMGISGDFEASNTLFNFHDAKKVTMSGIGVQGSVLAVNADVNFYSGSLNGQLIADTFRGKNWGVGSLTQSSFNNDIAPSFDAGFRQSQEHRAQVPDSANTLALSAFAFIAVVASRRLLTARKAG